MRHIIFFFLTVASFTAQAELVGPDAQFYMPAGQYDTNRSGDEQMLQKDVSFVMDHLTKPTKYIYINRCVKDVCTTYVIQNDSKNQWHLVDKYPTLAGLGTGVGCETRMTEAGLFVVGQKEASNHHHENWASDELLSMTPIKTNATHECPSHDSEKVIHGRKDLEGKACGLPLSGQTHGCVGVPPSKFQIMAQQASQGAVIYNLNAQN